MEAFVSTVDEIAAEKALERAIQRIAELAQSLDETLQTIQRDFEAELRYLDLDLVSPCGCGVRGCAAIGPRLSCRPGRAVAVGAGGRVRSPAVRTRPSPAGERVVEV